MISSASSLFAKDLFLDPKPKVYGDYIRLNDVLLEESRDQKYNRIFLGQNSGTKTLSVTYIQRRLEREGYFTLKVKMKQDADAITVQKLAKKPEAIVALKQDRDPIVASIKKAVHVKKDKAVSGRYVVLKEAVKSGDVIHKDMLEYRSFRRVYRDGYTDVEQLIGMKSKRTLRKGSILMSSHIEKQRLIYKGDSVKVRVVSPGIEISSIGRALEDGDLGDSIEVKRRSETLICRVIGANLVEVDK